MIRYDALPEGLRIAGRYLVDELVGQGRSACVYRALDLETKSSVALKVLDPFLAQDPTSLERFAREVSAEEFPHVVDHVRYHQEVEERDETPRDEFAFVLDLILDGLERANG